jgi:DNA polymerase I
VKDVAFDTETYLIAPGRLAPRLVCASFAESKGVVLLPAGDALAYFRDLLENPNVRLIGHNVAFDMAVMIHADPSLAPRIFDAYSKDRVVCTQVNETMDWIGSRAGTQSFSLAACAKRHLDVEMAGKAGEDAWRFRYRELEGIPVKDWPIEARSYALLDARYTYDVWQAQDRWPDLHNQVRAAFALHLMGCWGVRTDPIASIKLEKRLRKEEKEILEKLEGTGFIRPNGTKDTKAIRAAVEAAYNGEPPLTEKGSVSTSRETLTESGDQSLANLAELGTVAKEITAFVPVVKAGVEFPINPRWNVLVNSGRTSCRGPNLQQLPKRPGVRECFVPRPGNVFFGADYSVNELRTLAQCLFWEFGESKMRDALLRGQELHLTTAAAILEISYEEALSRFAKGDKEVKGARTLSKVENFGLPGGLSPKTFVLYAKGFGVTITEAQARTLKAEWLDAYPEMRWYFQARGDETSAGPYTVEQPWSGRFRAGVGYCDGLNTRFQGLAADGAKQAMWEIAREMYAVPDSPLFGTRMVAFIHDEFLCEGPEDKASAAAYRLADLMVKGMDKVAPDVPHIAEPYLSRRWYKDAEGVCMEDGTLIPWEPDEE